jgi:hypothetical protein
MKKQVLIFFALLGSLSVQAQRMDDVTEHSPYIKVVDEYNPAPGQFVNVHPIYEAGDDAAAMARKCTDSIANNKKSLIALGGCGGYVTFHFDHSIANVKDQNDVLILGNCSFENNSEPGIIMISKDVNQNGLPDDPWYELAGSADVDSVGKVVYGYSITYSRPTTEDYDGTPSPVSKDITVDDYIPWSDNQGASGFMHKNRYNEQTYYPQWVSSDQLTFGMQTLLPKNATNTLSYPYENWLLKPLAWGYVDNKPNADLEACSFNFDNAVEVVSRKPVEIDFVDFIRVYNAINQDCGWIGETSTEVTGAEDLHLDTSIQRVKDSLAGIRTLQTAPRSGDDCYDLQGRKTHAVGKGLYIRNGKKYFVK